MSFIDQLIVFADKAFNQNQVVKRTISKEEFLTKVSSNSIHYLYNKYWRFAPNNQKNRMLIAASLTILSIYIISPTLTSLFLTQEQKQEMFNSKRKDKYTTGLINTRNDCFANSSIQAFAALPGLGVYLNDMLKQHKLLSSLPIQTSESGEIPQLLLHEALAKILHELQETVTAEHYVSVWPFLQVIEKIFSSKISTNQNDAHELVQLILETLDNENIKFRKFVKQNNLNFVIPDFPFNGVLADQLTCLSCLNSSKPSFHPFAVLSLAVPQSSSTSLQDMLKENEVETINGYNCLRCKVKAILKVEADQKTEPDAVTKKIVSKLQRLEKKLTINDDLPEDLEIFIKDYNFGGFKTENLKSTIVKKTLVIKAPRLLTVHLSRSMFTGTQVTRNSCRVIYEDTLAINTDEVLAKAYTKKQKLAKKARQGIVEPKKVKVKQTPDEEDEEESEEDEDEDEDDNDADDDDDEDDDDYEGYDEDRNEPQQLARIHSKVLTTHEEDATYHDPEEDQSQTTNQDEFSQNSQSQSDTNTSPESDDNPDDVNDDAVDEDDSSESDLEDHELNASKQSVKYRLRAVIRHHGTHNAGHYECYRHKPAFLKDTESGYIVNTSPLITFGEDYPEPVPEANANPNEDNSLEPSTSSTPLDSNTVSEGGVQRRKSTRLRKLSDKISGRPSVPTSPQPNTATLNGGEGVSATSGAEDNDETDNDDDPSNFAKFRNRIGSFVSRSRRPSISLQQTNQSTVGSRRGSIPAIPQNMIPANSESSTHLSELSEGITNLELSNATAETKKLHKRFKKISSVVKFPYWRISDTKVAEVKKYEVLRETQAVYMIYFERVK